MNWGMNRRGKVHSVLTLWAKIRGDLYLPLVLMRLILIALAMMAFVPASLQAADSGALSGRWNGGWSSQTTGHKGPMQATFQTSGTGSVQATFRGRFFKVIPFVYRTELNVVATGEDYVEMAGSKRLGPLLGSYSYHAVATGGTFEASYRTKRDQGTFSLRRNANR